MADVKLERSIDAAALRAALDAVVKYAMAVWDMDRQILRRLLRVAYRRGIVLHTKRDPYGRRHMRWWEAEGEGFTVEVSRERSASSSSHLWCVRVICGLNRVRLAENVSAAHVAGALRLLGWHWTPADFDDSNLTEAIASVELDEHPEGARTQQQCADRDMCVRPSGHDGMHASDGWDQVADWIEAEGAAQALRSLPGHLQAPALIPDSEGAATTQPQGEQ